MSKRPILFNGPMVRAILDGTKTQTRRVVKFIPHMGSPDHWCYQAGTSDLERVIGDYRRFCPYGVPGDTLWVRETWAVGSVYDKVRPRDLPLARPGVAYPANERVNGLRLRPSIHMPRWASRIELEATGVRVERVQSISEEDCDAEGLFNKSGVHLWHCSHTHFHPDHTCSCGDNSAQEEFRDLWDSINAKRGFGWDENPWVWVVEFRRTK